MSVLRIFWVSATILFTILFIVKFILCAWLGSLGLILPVALGIFACLYLLFILEGLQTAGLQIQDLDRDAVEHVLEHYPVGSRKDVMPVFDLWNRNFDGFEVGRQLFTIFTVVLMAFLLKALQLPMEKLEIASEPVKNVIGFLNTTLFAYVSSTILPNWYSQLIPQFLADGRVLAFLTLPGVRLINELCFLLDKLQLGYPAHAILNLIVRSPKWGPRKYLTVGKRMYYEASLNFYGRAKKCHEISFALGKPTTVTEKIAYMFQSGINRHLDHKIQLSGPIEGDINVKIELPDGVYGEVEARNACEMGLHIYWIMITLNQSLPRERVEADEVLLEIEYQTNVYTDVVGKPYAISFSSPLPTKEAKISIQNGSYLLRRPKVCIVEEVDGGITTALDNSKEGDWEIFYNKNQAEILFDHPTVATVYQIEFQSMNVALDTKPESISLVDSNLKNLLATTV